MEELKKFRKSTGMTAEAFADSISVSKSLYEKVENGFRRPSGTFIGKLKRKYPQFDANIFFTNINHTT